MRMSARGVGGESSADGAGETGMTDADREALLASIRGGA